MNDYFAAILFFLPAGVSNIAPVFANKLPLIKDWDSPIDFGKSYKGKRLLGDNKRWRGLIFGTLMGGITGLIVSKLNTNTIVTISPFLAGMVMGFGALLGDAVGSFFKRLANVQAGDSWFPFDQLDFVIGGLLAILAFVELDLWVIFTILIVYFLLHLIVSYVGFKLGLKTKPI